MLKYMVRFQEQNKGKHSFHVITFEQPNYALDPSETKSVQEEYRKQHDIYWYPRQYNSGGPLMILKKGFDFINAFLSARNLVRKYSIGNVIGFTSISGVISMMIARYLKLKLCLLNIEPHSDYMVDFGFWSEGSLKYKLLKRYEEKLYERADFLAVPTMNAYKERIGEAKNGNLYFVPTCIDTNDFEFTEKGRTDIRGEIGVSAYQQVILYLGKFGGIYYTIEEAAEEFLRIARETTDVFFYVITPDNEEEVKDIFNKKGLGDKSLVRGKISYEDLSKHISAADYGIMLVPSWPSQLYRCPIKTANYMACGVPYIITPGIGDDSDLAEEAGVGVVLRKEQLVKLNVENNAEYIKEMVKKHRGIHLVVDWMEKVL
ncbi:MAG: glycosyltransferase [Cyclobacteriaceae bacterium]